jgi:hypothetical protein
MFLIKPKFIPLVVLGALRIICVYKTINNNGDNVVLLIYALNSTSKNIVLCLSIPMVNIS